MSVNIRLKRRFTSFVDQLSPDECREQLVLAYLQMERCQEILRGDDVPHVTMMDNGMSSDLELFYLCKKVRKELDFFENLERYRRNKQCETYEQES